MSDEKQENSEEVADEPQPVAIFATIHWRSKERPNGYTLEQVAAINEELNKPKAK